MLSTDYFLSVEEIPDKKLDENNVCDALQYCSW